ncbi:acetyltransferase [Rhodomicrobium udaipurense JA643]|uniref:Gamma carbonic anhydrase family protein n=1 Tax=Rhodomicrobium udaipurense TaxID=1202716 RepID=A0A8I1KGA9_9HYPH|nr:gamma carbonic anhydrase family protein [Rhodomicrobium udaipurense]KAI93661.1 acetyltransferase [Rhodomicrobium udaipurense JA643]MBJ7542560.1 gamma carbonic anhydrase family protein [Rhodomicrobium udaipurense]
MAIYALDGISPELPHEGDYWIAPTAVLLGRVVLGRDASVWFGSVLRGDNDPIEIGGGTNIQDMTMIHTDLGAPTRVGRGCTIGHRVTLHGCTVGDNCLIGMGATILNHAVIGDNCLIGAGALITEGKQIPAGSVVLGSPGKIVREVTAAEIEGFKRSAAGYMANARRFRTGLASGSV